MSSLSLMPCHVSGNSKPWYRRSDHSTKRKATGWLVSCPAVPGSEQAQTTRAIPATQGRTDAAAISAQPFQQLSLQPRLLWLRLTHISRGPGVFIIMSLECTPAFLTSLFVSYNLLQRPSWWSSLYRNRSLRTSVLSSGSYSLHSTISTSISMMKAIILPRALWSSERGMSLTPVELL